MIEWFNFFYFWSRCCCNLYTRVEKSEKEVVFENKRRIYLFFLIKEGREDVGMLGRLKYRFYYFKKFYYINFLSRFI